MPGIKPRPYDVREPAHGRLHADGRCRLREDIEKVYERFPALRKRRSRLGGTPSGGEQHMLAIGRALLARPKRLVKDAPSMGPPPLYVENTFEIIQGLNTRPIAILLVEQNATVALTIADRG